jgi:hypothetical protein
LSKITYEIKKYVDGVPELSADLSENQVELIYAALNDFQDEMYNEDSPYYNDNDASDFSEIQLTWSML